MQEWDDDFIAQRFDLTSKPRPNALFSMKARDLVDPTHMNELVQIYAPLIKAHELTAAGTYISSWLTSPSLGLSYMISVWNRALTMTLDNMTIELFYEDDYPQFAFVIPAYEIVEAPTSVAERAIWLKECYRAYFQDFLHPLLTTLAKVTGNPEAMLWGQFPTKFNYHTDAFVALVEQDSIKQQVMADYDVLCHQLEGESFGLQKNPFRVRVRWIEDIRDPQAKVRIKNQCCLYYKTGEQKYCYTCPRIKEDERALMRIRA
ncbi:Fe-S oxidoreductase [Brevibacillus sp. FIR094]|uniref:Fe-S oxidoreductase n=1 Tax=Brevibacillus sp. FIR094 TaxID=3134809 RepID=UPI003D1D700F